VNIRCSKNHLIHSRLLVILLLIGSPSQAYVNGKLEKTSTGRITINLEILREAIVSQPPGLASGKGKGFAEDSPARPKWLVQQEELSGGIAFGLCLPEMYEASQVSLLNASGNGNSGSGKASAKGNTYSLKLDGTSTANALSACSKGKMLQIVLENETEGVESKSELPDMMELVTMIIKPE
jgi:hypothetical protein